MSATASLSSSSSFFSSSLTILEHPRTSTREPQRIQHHEDKGESQVVTNISHTYTPKPSPSCKRKCRFYPPGGRCPGDQLPNLVDMPLRQATRHLKHLETSLAPLKLVCCLSLRLLLALTFDHQDLRRPTRHSPKKDTLGLVFDSATERKPSTHLQTRPPRRKQAKTVVSPVTDI